jgi:branched-chain amino acid transport system ATP-binding protein
VRFDGRPIDGLSPDARVRLGMGRTWQSIELFDDLDVRENLEVAATRPRWWSPLLDVVWPSRREAERAVDYAIGVLDLGHIVGRFPRQLSLGQRKLVGIARAIAADPRLLLLDEPAAGLDPSESSDLGNRLRGLLDHDITVLLVDHDMGLVLTVCDIVHVLEFGALIATGPPAAIRADERVISAYLGTEVR